MKFNVHTLQLVMNIIRKLDSDNCELITHGICIVYRCTVYKFLI